MSNEYKQLRRFLILSFAISVIGLFVLDAGRHLDEKSFGREIGKTLLTIIGVTVVGSTATLLMFLYQKQHEKASKDSEKDRLKRESVVQLKLDIINRINSSYSSVKRVRRMLRAKTLLAPVSAKAGGDVLLKLDEYDIQMGDLNSTQLDYEIIKKEIETNLKIFLKGEEIVKLIGSIESYLNRRIREYEKCRKLFSGDPPVLALSKLPELEEFMLHESAAFQEGFVESSKKLLALIRAEIFTDA